MVVNIESAHYDNVRPIAGMRVPRHSQRHQHLDRHDEQLTIGIVNNMAGAAFKATERQFVSLLDAASGGIPVQMSFYMLPGLTRTEAGGQHFASHYSNIDSLLGTKLDGIIVTGREPRMASLRDEPYWKSFTEVLEWSRQSTLSSIWSCLAAHAAVLHLDGIQRHKGDEKRFGVFNCSLATEHPLTQTLPTQFKVPHSRWNDIREKDLSENGYIVLSRINGFEVDAFVKEDDSQFVFFQGHLEYETDTLMREYRRDAGRYIRGETNSYPLLPQSYFDPVAESALMSLRDSALLSRDAGLLHRVAAALEETALENTWQHPAVCIYRNWLECIRAKKAVSRQKQSAVLTHPHPMLQQL